MSTDSTAWKTGSRHYIEMRVKGTAGDVLQSLTYAVRQGINGDVNGDGYGDVLVGAKLANGSGTDRGQAFIFHGSSTGVDTTIDATLNYPGSDNGARFGQSVKFAGDVNGDGYADVIIGAPYADDTGTDKGIAYIFHGSSTGVDATADATLTFPSTENGAFFGASVSAAGDINGDGYGDVVIGAYGANSTRTDLGQAFIFQGSSTGVDNTADSTLNYPSTDDGAYFGTDVSYAGDVNGDGFGDVLIGAPGANGSGIDLGSAFLFHGSSSGVDTTVDTTLNYPGTDNDAFFGFNVSFAGDVNGDDYADVIIGAYGADGSGIDRGRAYVFHGSSSGISTTASTTLNYAQNDDYASFGYSVSTVGDADADGYADVIIGSPYTEGANDGSKPDHGKVWVYYGTSSGIGTDQTSVQYAGSDGTVYLGISVSTAGDVNGDGNSDAVMGIPYANDVGTDRGLVYVVHGSATGIKSTASSILTQTENNAVFGISVD